MKVFAGWLVLVFALFICAAMYGCSSAQKAAEPKEQVDEAAWCFGATIAGQDLVTCSPAADFCEQARQATAPAAEAISGECQPVQLQMEHRDAPTTPPPPKPRDAATPAGPPDAAPTP